MAQLKTCNPAQATLRVRATSGKTSITRSRPRRHEQRRRPDEESLSLRKATTSWRRRCGNILVRGGARTNRD
jgi:hypothetical protein